MRIGILNLPFDNNYGGNLQRYALVRTLQEMGHNPVHINLRNAYKLPYWKMPYSYTKRIIKKICGANQPINIERATKRKNKELEVNAERLYQKYVPHTPEVHNFKEVERVCKEMYFDCMVVGSDQVWRNAMVKGWGLNNFMLEFVKSKPQKKIAYAVSLGSGNERLYDKQIKKYAKLYNGFDAVSVREYPSLKLFEEYGWTKPKAIHVLDPIFLRSKEEYVEIAERAPVTNAAEGKIFCYILDGNEQIDGIVRAKETELGTEALTVSLKDTAGVSIEQWLYNIHKCRMVITDSFHGVAFSILFNKPFVFCGNVRRGNMRIKSLFKMFMIDAGKTEHIDWQTVNCSIDQWRKTSIEFLENNLKSR